MKKSTILDVAKRAGVSSSTVSHVLNHYDDIGEETKKKVLAVAKELDYAPNYAAKRLSSKNKKQIALILNEINVTRGVAMPLEILGGVIEALDKTEYEFVFYAVNGRKQKMKSLKQFCGERDISGLIIQGLTTEDPYYHELKRLDVPTVAIDMTVKNGSVGSVSIDNQAAAAEVARRLLASGNKKILFINGSNNAAVAMERVAGVRSVISHPLISYANFSEEMAFQIVEQMERIEEIDAIFAASDLMAIGVIKALKKRNVAKKIDVVGFDDITLASYITPSLTTVRQNIPEFTKVAVADLIQQIETGKVVQKYIPYEIIVRDSARL